MLLLTEGIVVAAASVRAVAGEHREAFSTSRIVDALFPDAVVTGRRLPAGVQEAVSTTSRGPVIVYSRELSPPAQRFVIAHAIAHLLFDADRPTAAARVGFAGDPATEARADAFAAELLVPLERLAALIEVRPASGDDFYLDQVDSLASHFNVPRGLIDKRIREVHR